MGLRQKGRLGTLPVYLQRGCVIRSCHLITSIALRVTLDIDKDVIVRLLKDVEINEYILI